MTSTHSFLGYACTEAQLSELATKFHSPYAGFPNAVTEFAWELNEYFQEEGPFRLMTALIDGEVGYVFVLGMKDADISTIPKKLRQSAKAIFGGEPLTFGADLKLGIYTSKDDIKVKVSSVITSNLDEWEELELD